MGWQRTKTIFRHRRIFLVFLFSIVLPGAYIGYVGFRSVVREQALQRGLLVQSLGQTLGFEIDRIERTLEQSLDSAARRLLVFDAPLVPAVLDEFAESHAWIDNALVFDAHGNLRGPLPYAEETRPGTGPPVPEGDVRERLDAAAQLELHGNHSAARLSYEQLLQAAPSLESKVVVLSYLARSATATGDQESARKAYRTIIQTDPTFRVTRPIPYAAFAWLWIIEDLVKQRRGDDALLSCLKFYDCLLDWYFRFSAHQHSYLLGKIHAQIVDLASPRASANNHGNRLRELEGQERALASSLTQAREIESWLYTHHATLYTGAADNGVRHDSFSINGMFTPISLIPVDTPVKTRHWVVLVVRPETLEHELILPALQGGDWAKDFTVALLKDTVKRTNPGALVTAKMHGTAPLFPSREVAVFPKTVSTVEFFGIHIPLLSIGFVLLVTSILVLGIFIMYRDIRREEELSTMKSDFISNVSHELKTPIAAIRMLADNLRERRVVSASRRMEYYRLISQEGARLSHLIENILDFSRIEKQKKAFRFEKHDVSQIVRETVCEFKSLVDERASTITYEVAESLPSVLVDPDAIRLAVFNLLDNAVKYSKRGTPIRARTRRDNEFLCIEVEDRGRGISQVDQQKIFEKFYRVDEHEGEKIPGSGIGLTLVKEIAQAHKGSVHVSSQRGSGSTFQILLPLGG